MPKKVNLTQYSLAEIHEHILKSKNDNKAAKNIGVKLETLNCYLARFFYDELPLSSKRLRAIHPDRLRTDLKKYEEPGQTTKKANLDNHSIYQIHKIILETRTLSEAAHYFGVCAVTLGRYLTKFGFQGRPLSYEQLKDISPHELKSENVVKNKSLLNAARVALDNLPLHDVHEVVIKSHTLREAASDLGVCEKYLIRYIGKYTYNDHPLTFKSLKDASVEELRVSGLTYDAPFHVKPVCIYENSIVKIYKHIAVSSSLYYAANSLGATSVALTNYLANLTYQGQPLSFERLKNLSLSDLATEYPECKDLANPQKICDLYHFFRSSSSERMGDSLSRSNSMDSLKTIDGFFEIK